MDKDKIVVVFVQPSVTGSIVNKRDRMPAEHLGLDALAASIQASRELKGKAQVHILDQQTFALTNEEVIKKTVKLEADLVGFSPVALSMENFIKIGEGIHHALPKAFTLGGGHHLTFDAVEVLEGEPWLKAILGGYADHSIIRLVCALLANGSLSEVDGLYWRKGKDIVFNPYGPAPDINKLPISQHRILKEWISQNPGNHDATISLDRGCPKNCSFCTTPAFQRLHPGYCLQHASAERIVEEIKALVELGIRFVFLSSDNFFGDETAINRAKDLASLLIEEKLGIEWSFMARADTILDHKPLIGLMKASGVGRIVIGFEAGNENSLKRYRKGTTPRQNLEAYEFLTALGIRCLATFINFDPRNTFEEIKDNVALLRQTKNASLYSLTNCLMAIPGTDVIEQLRQEGLLPKNHSYKSSPYDYSYLDRRVGKVANALLGIRSDPDFETAFECNAILLNITAGWMNDARWQSIQTKIQDLNCRFVLASLALGETGWNGQEFRALQKKYLEAIDMASKELKKLCESCGL